MISCAIKRYVRYVQSMTYTWTITPKNIAEKQKTIGGWEQKTKCNVFKTPKACKIISAANSYKIRV